MGSEPQAREAERRAAEQPAQTVEYAEPSRTFQGLPVRAITWRGRRAEIVSGVTAVKLAAAARIGREHGLTAAGTPGQRPALDIAVLPTSRLVGGERGLTIMSTDAPAIEWAEPVLLDHGSALPNDPYIAQQWALDSIDAGAAWSVGAGNVPVVVAVLDSGVPIEAGQLSHADLNDATRFLLGRDMVNNDNDPADDHGHGSHVLGIIAATRNNGIGIAGLWTGPVYVIKVLGSSLDGSSVTFKDGVAAAVDFAKARGAHLVINYSAGGPDGDVKKTAVEYARDEGALIVAAAGNGRGDPLDYPAAYAETYDHVVAVGAVDEGLAPASFGSRGPGMTVVAPGTNILSTLPNYAVTLNTSAGRQTKYDRLDGTSQATPHASALAALIWSRKPDWTAARVREHVRTTSTPLSEDPELVGSGIISVTRALASL